MALANPNKHFEITLGFVLDQLSVKMKLCCCCCCFRFERCETTWRINSATQTSRDSRAKYSSQGRFIVDHCEHTKHFPTVQHAAVDQVHDWTLSRNYTRRQSVSLPRVPRLPPPDPPPPSHSSPEPLTRWLLCNGRWNGSFCLRDTAWTLWRVSSGITVLTVMTAVVDHCPS